jgi:hypothetical protein
MWERIKRKTKDAVKSIPSLIGSILQKIISFVLALLGLNGGIATILWKAIPSKMILQWVGILVSMFFPILGPILGLSKLVL